MKRSEIRIPEPCHADWSEMDGDQQKRFCGQCTKHVHNLSEMTEPAARAVLSTPDVCVRFRAGADGTIRFQSRRRFLAAAVASTIALPAAAAVTPHTDAGEPGLLTRLYAYLFDTPEPVPEPIEEVQGGAMWEPEPIKVVEPTRPLMGKPVMPTPPPEDE